MIQGLLVYGGISSIQPQQWFFLRNNVFAQKTTHLKLPELSDDCTGACVSIILAVLFIFLS